MSTQPLERKRKTKFENTIENIVFKGSSRLLLIFTFIMFGSLMIYGIVGIKEFIHYIQKFNVMTREGAMLVFLEMVDLFLIAALGKIMIAGGYHSYISKNHNHPDEKIGSGMLKVKLATALIGVTSISLLNKSIQISLKETILWEELYKLGYIHGWFLAGALVVSIIDYLHQKTEIQIEQNGLKNRNLEDGKKG